MPISQSSIDALLYPMQPVVNVWNTSNAPAYNFTYQFAGASQPGDLNASFSGWTAFTDPAKRAALVSVLQEYEEIINVTFTEVTGQADPDINFGLVSLNGGQGGFNYSYSTSNGQVVSRTYDAFAVFGSTINLTTLDGRNLLLHEVGHALSLKHPGAYDVGGNIPPPPYLSAAEDNNKYSVMSYNANPDNGLDSDHLMIYDIAALQARWGANMSTRTGNDTYGAPTGRMLAIWDAGGIDTISGQGRIAAVEIDLHEGAFSSIGGTDNVAIAYNVAIERATGGSVGDLLIGNALANVLNGLGGDDEMRGEAGNDIYIVNRAGDIVVEILDAGIDLIKASVNIASLASNVEKLTLTGTAALNGTGNALNNTITGNNAANVLNGATGSDRLLGGLGDDTYIVNGGDVVVEAATAGIDTVKSSASYRLTAEVEKLLLTGSSAINGTGNDLGNIIVGNSAANVLNGGLDNDTMTGGTGHDTFVFTTTLGASNVDRINDYSVTDDTIKLDDAIFQTLGGTGQLDATMLVIGTAAADGDDHIIYNSATGALYYDANGSAAGGQVRFAILGVGLALTSADFVVF